MRTIQMSSYTVGEDCFNAIPAVLESFGAKKIVLIGGERALGAAAQGIKDAVAGSDIEVLDTIVYGKNCTKANIQKLVDNKNVQDAEIVFAIGGGKAIDTGKCAAKELGKTVFSVPTICSNCSSATAIAVCYNDDDTLLGYEYPDAPAHIFINPKIIAEAPREYFWAGVGDALSKQPEVEYATSGDELGHTAELGLSLAHTCSEPLFTYGVQGMKDVEANTSSEAVKQVALDIVVNTGYVSNLTNQPDFYYNSSLAHAFYYGTTGIEGAGERLHGVVVSFGVLVLLAYTGQDEQMKRYAQLNKEMGLPVTLADMGLSADDLDSIVERAQDTTEWKAAHPKPFNVEKFRQAIVDADAYGQTL